ncbi:putative leucine-rich repeat domain superfamily, F-box-like domain superfamily [Helianthus anomalus]
MKSKRLSKAKRLSLDIITALPQPVIETILCLLLIREAARTSILARDWRYKWTNIPKLVFSKPNGRQIMETSKHIPALHKVMSLRQDPIHEFTFSIDVDCFSKTGLPSCEYNLPFSVFSLHHLTKLYLIWCGLDHQPAFNGFGILVVLSLDILWISRKTLLHLLSSCPSLKSFRLRFSNLEPEIEFVKVILPKSPKLKKVSIKSVVKKDQEPGMLKTLLRTPRVSGVEIDVV